MGYSSKLSMILYINFSLLCNSINESDTIRDRDVIHEPSFTSNRNILKLTETYSYQFRQQPRFIKWLFV